MSTVLRIHTLRVSIVAGILSAAVCAAAQTPPVIYQGLRHTPVGTAVLQLDPSRNALDVHTSDPTGGDGVAVDLGGTATNWSAKLETPPPEPGGAFALTLHAIADGQRISSAFLRQIDGEFGLQARFTGSTNPTYAVQVYDNGRLVGAQGGVSLVVRPPRIQIPCEFLQDGCSWASDFRNTLHGECEWDFTFRRSGPITLPNGVQVIGNEIRLIEEVRAAGQYPYLTFDGITMQTNARVLTLLSETAR
jgi:hypothetical protein